MQEIVPPERQTNKYQSLLTYYGLRTEKIKDEFIGDCPFNDCPATGKSGKFAMNVATGQYHCWMCQAKGNQFTFLKEFHKNYFNQVSEDQLRHLIKLRSGALHIDVLKEMQVCFNPLRQEWMLPAWGPSGHSKGITNLYVWRTHHDADSGKTYKRVQSAPNCRHVPYGIHNLRAGNRPLFLLEGHWDYLSFRSLLLWTNLATDYDCVGAPGSEAFPKDHLGIFNGRRVILVYDNDIAGEQGLEKLCKLFNSNGIMPSRTDRLSWPAGFDSGFDLSDIVTKLPVKYHKK